MTSEREWKTAQWRELAVTWFDEQLGKAGISRTSEVEQPRVRPWSTVLRADTTAGVVWLKAPGPLTLFEIELYGLLCEVVPDQVLEPIAADVERGWILLPDGGPSLGDGSKAPIDGLLKALPQYGELQRRMMPHVARMLELGAADMRPDAMPKRFDEAVDAVRRRSGDIDVVRRIAARRDVITDWCAELAEMSVPASIEHSDLHSRNIFLHGERAVFYDWGDSVVAHPFASMVVGLSALYYQWGIDLRDPLVTRMRDAYLEAFSDLAPHQELVRQQELACRVGVIARTLVWERALAPAEGLTDWEDGPLETLKAVLNDSWP